MDEANISRELEESGDEKGGDGSSTSPGAPATASRVSSLVDRCLIRLVKCNYDGARDVCHKLLVFIFFSFLVFCGIFLYFVVSFLHVFYMFCMCTCVPFLPLLYGVRIMFCWPRLLFSFFDFFFDF